MTPTPPKWPCSECGEDMYPYLQCHDCPPLDPGNYEQMLEALDHAEEWMLETDTDGCECSTCYFEGTYQMDHERSRARTHILFNWARQKAKEDEAKRQQRKNR